MVDRSGIAPKESRVKSAPKTKVKLGAPARTPEEHRNWRIGLEIEKMLTVAEAAIYAYCKERRIWTNHNWPVPPAVLGDLLERLSWALAECELKVSELERHG